MSLRSRHSKCQQVSPKEKEDPRKFKALQGGGLDTREASHFVISVFPLYFKFALLGHPPERESFITHSLCI